VNHVETHLRAVKTHEDAAGRHEEAARRWTERGDLTRADLERRNMELELLAANLERDRAAVEENDPLPED
jgi:hypothetical protein